MERWVLLASIGVTALALGAYLIATIDPDCNASGSYGNYCGLQQPHIWGYPVILVGVVLVAWALVARRRSRRAQES